MVEAGLGNVRASVVWQGEGYAGANWQKRGCAKAGGGSGERMGIAELVRRR